MAEPSAKRLDQKTEPDIADLERRGGSDDNAITSGPHLDFEAVRVELVCNICLDVPSHVATVLPCLHSFCWCCIEEWFKKHRKCPRCAQSASSAKPNSALNNLVQALIEADPTLAKPEELIAQEKEKLIKYKAQKSSAAVLYPQTGYGTEDDDNESDMDAEDFRHYWPCPCCAPGNRSGYVCPNPIPVPAGAVGLAGGPVRGGDWPPLEEAEDFLPIEKVDAHATCGMCASWIPAVGVPEAQCAACGISTCSPYDTEGVCPFGQAHQHLESYTFGFQDFSTALNYIGLDAKEVERIRSYMTDKGISVTDIVTSTLVKARELVDGKDQQAADEQPVPAEQAVNNVADAPIAVPAEQAVNNVADAPVALQAEQVANDVADAPMALQAEQVANDVADAPMAVPPEQIVNNIADVPMAVQAGQAVNNIADAPMAERLPYDDEAVLCLAGHNGECMGVFCHKLDVDRATALLNARFCRQCALNVLGRLADWWWTDIRTNHHDTLPESIRKLPDCPHGVKCPTHKRDLAHAVEFNHFCKEKPAEQPENTEAPAAGQLEQA